MRHVRFHEFLTLDHETLTLIKRYGMGLRMQNQCLMAILSGLIEQGNQHLLAYALSRSDWLTAMRPM